MFVSLLLGRAWVGNCSVLKAGMENAMSGDGWRIFKSGIPACLSSNSTQESPGTWPGSFPPPPSPGVVARAPKTICTHGSNKPGAVDLSGCQFRTWGVRSVRRRHRLVIRWSGIMTSGHLQSVASGLYMIDIAEGSQTRAEAICINTSLLFVPASSGPTWVGNMSC